MQKLVTVYLRDVNDAGTCHIDGKVQEHLQDLLAEGWRIKQLTTLSGNRGGETEVSTGWIVLLLERS